MKAMSNCNQVIPKNKQMQMLTPETLPNGKGDRAVQSHLKHGMPKVNNCVAVPSTQTS